MIEAAQKLVATAFALLLLVVAGYIVVNLDPEPVEDGQPATSPSASQGRQVPKYEGVLRLEVWWAVSGSVENLPLTRKKVSISYEVNGTPRSSFEPEPANTQRVWHGMWFIKAGDPWEVWSTEINVGAKTPRVTLEAHSLAFSGRGILLCRILYSGGLYSETRPPSVDKPVLCSIPVG